MDITLPTNFPSGERRPIRVALPAVTPQQEDPHSSPLHHDYELGRDDLRFSPEQPSGEGS